MVDPTHKTLYIEDLIYFLQQAKFYDRKSIHKIEKCIDMELFIKMPT